MRQFSRRRRKQEARDKAIVRSLFVVFLLSLISFIPFGVLRVVESYQKISYVVDISFVLLLVFNCSVNWIVYGVMNRSFRRGYVRLLRNVLCKCW
nr:hypothetical protein BaRGS_022727 [Batillaria attramentaria]